MAELEVRENAYVFQDVLRFHEVDTLQGWKDLTSVERCGRLLTDLTLRCRGYLRAVTGDTPPRSLFLDGVQWSEDQMTVFGRWEAGEESAVISRFTFARAACSRFAVIVLAAPPQEDSAHESVAFVLWHDAFALGPANVSALINHFNQRE